ncbi:Flagellum site-determining protein YlxH [Marinobacterium sp. xm-d-420]|jgi:flagellar biosynthesis protein FlhG|nr:Flagellum site-determining protein YlxH [Marinobacterium sp. xm-d-420]
MMSSSKSVQVIALTSGKGGVGKTNTAVNMALALQKAGNRVLLLDADLGLANVDVMIGLYATYNLSHVLSGEKRINEILLDGPGGIQVVPASSGVKSMAELNEQQIGYLIQAFSELNEEYDYLIIDTAAGISSGVLSFLQAAHHVVVVVVDEPSSITDAYAMIKLLRRDYDVNNIWLVSNLVDSNEHGEKLFNKLNGVVERFLGEGINYLCAVPRDTRLSEANQRQKAVLEVSPSSKSSQAYQRAAAMVSRWPKPNAARGQMEFFVERLIERASA